jgi:hypothetical protein
VLEHGEHERLEQSDGAELALSLDEVGVVGQFDQFGAEEALGSGSL